MLVRAAQKYLVLLVRLMSTRAHIDWRLLSASSIPPRLLNYLFIAVCVRHRNEFHSVIAAGLILSSHRIVLLGNASVSQTRAFRRQARSPL